MEKIPDETENNIEKLNFAKEVLERIQFSVLTDIFNAKLGRANQSLRKFSSSMIRFDVDTSSSTFGEGITIGLKELMPSGSPGRSLEILVMIIHEMAHYFSLGERNESYTKHGVSLVETTTSEPISGDGVNEAITERTAMEVAQEYIAQTGDRGFFYGEDDGEKMIAIIGTFAYPEQMKVFQSVLQKIAQSEGVEEQAVWESFQHAYYNNTNVAIGELYQSLKRALGKDTTSQLVHTNARNMEDPEVLNALLERLKPKE